MQRLCQKGKLISFLLPAVSFGKCFGKNLSIRASHDTEKVFFSDYRSFERKVKASFLKGAKVSTETQGFWG